MQPKLATLKEFYQTAQSFDDFLSTSAIGDPDPYIATLATGIGNDLTNVCLCLYLWIEHVQARTIQPETLSPYA